VIYKTSETIGNKHLIRLAYVILLIGGIFSLGFFTIFALAWQWRDPFPRLLGFILWVVSPMVLFSVIIFTLTRYFRTRGTAIALLIASSMIVGLGLVYYGLAIFTSDNQEANLAFIFGPIYQLASTFVLGILCIIIGIITKKSRGEVSSKRGT